MPSPVIEQRGSRRVRLFICGCVLLALTIVAGSPLPWPARVLAAALALVSGGRELYCTWPGSHGYIGELQVGRDGQLLCGFGPAPVSRVPVAVRHCWTLGGRVTGLTVCSAGGQRGRAVLFADQLKSDQWRHLHQCLRLGRA